ncbi:MAG: tetratricopeptide repeat protein [Bacteriovoracaceae bacterium]
MKSLRINLLTLVFAVSATLALTFSAKAATFNQEQFKTHLRWNFKVAKEQILLNKNPRQLKIETLDLDLFESLVKEIGSQNLAGEYFKTITYSKQDFPTKPATIEVTLKDEAVELFSFYKDADKKYILDFWVNTDLITAKNAALEKAESPASVLVKTAPVPNPDVKDTTIVRPGKLPKVSEVPKSKSNQVGTSLAPNKFETEIAPYRDFRYGAALIWDYSALGPNVEKVINLDSKTPDFLYPVSDREFDKDDKEAHMQLTINLFNKGKWGLMSKSINLYTNKYGTDKNFEINEFMKANALLKNNLKEKNKGITNSAINILKNIFERSENYEMKSAIAKYLIDQTLAQDENVQSMNMAKKLYVTAKGHFDNETALFAANVLLFTLGRLGQVDQIDSFVSDASVKKLLPAQLAMAYKSYVWLNMNQTDILIREFEKVEKGLVKPVHASILFNVAEAYFRNAQYDKAIQYFDEFLKDYSFMDKSSDARLRIAVAYDLTGKDVNEVLTLYKNAINRATNPTIRYEAKVRYVGLRVDRKRKLDDLDKETIVFLENSADEKEVINGDLKKLLWLVRLRTFLSTKFYPEALTYLTSIPLESMKASEKRLFEADGAEIIFGLINDYYAKEDYAKAVKIWETFKDKYVDKVALNPQINFAICHSYIKLGLNNSYDRTLEQFRALKGAELQTYPMWVDRQANASVSNLLSELSILKYMNSNSWSQAETKLNELIAAGESNARLSYYRGMIAFQLKKYKEAADSFEKLLVQQDGVKILSPLELSYVTGSYLESLYNLGANDKFKNVAKALINDLNSVNSPLVQQSLERVNYLLIESMMGESKPDYTELETLINSFSRRYKVSQYKGRISYLHGTTLLKINKDKEGEKVLRDLIKDREAPGYIRELAQTELSALELRRRSL